MLDRGGFTQGCRRTRPQPLPLTSACSCLFRNQGGQPHIQEHHQLLAICLLADMRYLYCTNQVFFDMWGTFFLNLLKHMHFFVLSKLQICKYNDCIDQHNLARYCRTFAPRLAKRGQRYNISSYKGDERGKKG